MGTKSPWSSDRGEYITFARPAYPSFGDYSPVLLQLLVLTLVFQDFSKITYRRKRDIMTGMGDAGAAAFNLALERRQALMGASGPGAILKNFKVFRIAAFACLGGLLYGYNQGMFSGILAMPAFEQRGSYYRQNGVHLS